MFIIGRGIRGQATLMHALTEGTTDHTLCGRQVNGWSRAYMKKAIKEILCMSCDRKLKVGKVIAMEPRRKHA
jgi:predicted ABC-class ATPase